MDYFNEFKLDTCGGRNSEVDFLCGQRKLTRCDLLPSCGQTNYYRKCDFIDEDTVSTVIHDEEKQI